MITEDQADVIEFLSSPAAHAGASVERVESHASVVFLAGPRALKLKRAVKYDYLDFSTAERRRAMCAAEVDINRRTAPEIYLGVVAVTRQPDGTLALNGPGTPVDWLVEMERFDQAQLFDRLATRGTLALELMRPLASTIATFHEAAARRPDHGGAAGMRWVIDGNAAGFAEQGAGVFDATECADLIDASLEEVTRKSRLLDSRREAGSVRQCHGDLHLRNIVLIDDRPTLFDAIEFNDEIACTDVLYDLAFLLMDLWRRQLPRHAHAVWNGYLAGGRELDGIPLLPLFLSCRAAVRAKTSATAATLQADAERRGELQAAARDYLAMARRLLQPPPACLVAIGGVSGTGKSAVANGLAPLLGAVPGAVVVRSDEIRKQLFGVDALHRLGPEGYTATMNERVYAILAQRVGQIVGAGHAAIADAVFIRSADRAAIEQVAHDAGVPFAGVWLTAPEAVLLARVEQRRGDVSDADAAVIHGQLARETGALTWPQRDASAPLGDVLRETAAMLRDRLPRGVVRPEPATSAQAR
jgi:aminoglycoside phosphotransferase family enzyme/predicted kinase